MTQRGWISAIVQYIWCGVDSNVSKRGLVFMSCIRPCGGLVIAGVTVWGLIIRLLRRFAVQSIRCDLLLLVCVCLLVATVSPKNSWTFKMRFEVWTSVGPKNHVLGWEPDPPGEGEILGRHHPEHCKVYGISRVFHSYSTAAMRPFAATCCESSSMCSLRSVSSLFVIFVVCWYWGTTMCWQLMWLPAFKIPKLINPSIETLSSRYARTVGLKPWRYLFSRN